MQNNLRFLASETFSAARFSAANNCWIPCVWLAISDTHKNYVERETGPNHKSIGAVDVRDESHMITLVPKCSHDWRCNRLVLL